MQVKSGQNQAANIDSHLMGAVN